MSEIGPQTTHGSRSHAERRAVEVAGIVGALVGALRMIEQGYVFHGSERVALDAEGMRVLAREVLDSVGRSNGDA